MKRITVNALVDIGCLITFITSFVSGLVLFFFLFSGGDRGVVMWSILALPGTSG